MLGWRRRRRGIIIARRILLALLVLLNAIAHQCAAKTAYCRSNQCARPCASMGIVTNDCSTEPSNCRADSSALLGGCAARGSGSKRNCQTISHLFHFTV